MDTRYTYYPGCSLHATGIEFHMSTKAIAEKLRMNLVEPEGWKCCGTSPAHNTDHYRSIKLPMETLAIAGELGHSYMTMPCAACWVTSPVRSAASPPSKSASVTVSSRTT